MNSQLACKEDYLQFMTEDNICAQLKFHNTESAIEIFNEFFSNNNFNDLGGDFHIRSLKNHMICLLVSLSRTVSINPNKIFKLRNSCNKFIANIESKNCLNGIIKVGECAIRSFGQIVKSSPYNSSSKIINNAITYIENNLEADLTLELVANEIHISKNYLSSLFYEKTNMKFTQFINFLRVAKAKELLSTCDFSLSYISSLCGFKNQSYFSTIFREHTKYTPLDYKKYTMSQLSK